MVLYIIGTFQPSASSLIGQETGVLPQRSKGRQLCLLPLVDSEIFSYCVHLLIACLKVQQYVRGGYCPTLSNCEMWWPVVRHGCPFSGLKHLPGNTMVWGHPFMTSTRRGRGVRLRWTHVDGGRGSSPMWTSTHKLKIRVHWRHTVFFSCKEVGIFFTRISSLDRKKVEIFLRYKLVI